MEGLGGKQVGQSRDRDRGSMGMDTDLDGSGQQPGEWGFDGIKGGECNRDLNRTKNPWASRDCMNKWED